MSHFTVLVIGEDLAIQLEPFWELDLPQDVLINDPRAEFNVEIPKSEIAEYCETKIKKFIEWLSKNDKARVKKYKTFLKDQDWSGFIDCYHGYDQNENGDYGYYSNPNAKWDWYMIGGRWSGYFTLKPDKAGIMGKRSLLNENEVFPENHADQARKGDIDWEVMSKNNKESAESDWAEHEKRLGEENYHAYFEYGIRGDESKESFIARRTSNATFAVLKDGQWYDRGEMGWWATVANEKDTDTWCKEFDKLVMSLPDDTLLTVVDCHI